jgi:Zn-dependent protease
MKHASRWTRLALLLSFIAAKSKLFVASVVKLKILAPLLSVFVSAFAYSFVLGWPAALLFLALLVVHEAGHVYVNRRLGIPASWPYFIPFFGAVIAVYRFPRGVEQEAWSALGGPVLGSIGALACLGIWALTAEPLFLWGFAVGLLLNLFNLIPMSPLDGGRIMAAVSRKIWLVALLAVTAIGFWKHDPYFFVLTVFGLEEVSQHIRPISWRIWLAVIVALAFIAWEWHSWGALAPLGFSLLCLLGELSEPTVIDHEEKRQYFDLPWYKRVMFASIYFALVSALFALVWWMESLIAHLHG